MNNLTRCSTHCHCGANCTCGDNCQCTETICCCEASSVLNSLGCHDYYEQDAFAETEDSFHSFRVTLEVNGMSCQSCVRKVESVLQKEGNAYNVRVDLKASRVTAMARYDVGQDGNRVPTDAAAEKMVTLLESVGLEASVLSIQDLSSPKNTSETNEEEQEQSQSPLFFSPKEPSNKELLQSSTSTQSNNIVETVELVVGGMTCSMCTRAIQSALQTTEGVVSARVSLATDVATIEFHPSLVDANQLADAVEGIGYTVTEIMIPSDNNETQHDDMVRAQRNEVLAKKRAFLYSLVGTIPILILTMILPHFENILSKWLNAQLTIFGCHMTREALLLWILATPVQFGSGWTFYRGAWYGLRTGFLGMDVLVAMGTTASYGYALQDTLFGSLHGAHFFETSAVLISFVLLGKYLNALAVTRTSDAITQLLQLQSKVALRVTPQEEEHNDKAWDPTSVPYKEEVVPIQLVKPGDFLKIKRGASIPADGVVTHGEMTVDQSMITGESVPVLKSPGSIVLGGTVCVEIGETTAFCRVTGVGSSTALSQIVRLVQDAQTRQVPIQNFADKVSSVFVPAVATLSVISFLVWYILCNTGVVPEEWYEGETDATFSLKFGIACLVISCPCALGLATPTAVMVGTGVGAKNGVLVKGGDSLEKASSIDSVVFDKTGTLTKGKPCITDFVVLHSAINAESDIQKSSCCSNTYSLPETADSDPPKSSILTDRNYLLWLLGSLERNSEHPLAAAVVSYAESQIDPSYLESNSFAQPSNFRALTGRGASGLIGDVVVAVGNRPFATMMDLAIPSQAVEHMARLEHDGQTAILAAFNGEVRVVMGVADELKSDAAMSISYLQDKMGMEVWMVTGDNSVTAQAISQRLNLRPDRVISEALPVAKVRHVRRLQAEGHVVAMIGDGINDSPALAQADVGMSLGTGAEIAAEASDMILVRGNVSDVCTALDLSRVIFRRIQLNFLWSLIYNCLGIPVAAGVFYPLIRTRLPPTVAALAMALSSLSVVSSSLALRLYRPPDVAAIQEPTMSRNCCQRIWIWESLCQRIMNFVVSGFTNSRPGRDEQNGDMTRGLLANDHTLGSEDSTARMEEGQV